MSTHCIRFLPSPHAEVEKDLPEKIQVLTQGLKGQQDSLAKLERTFAAKLEKLEDDLEELREGFRQSDKDHNECPRGHIFMILEETS